MPLDRFVLILVLVVVAAGLTVWLGTLIVAATQFSAGWLFLVPVALVAYVVWRVIAERLRSSEDDHYDNIEK